MKAGTEAGHYKSPPRQASTPRRQKAGTEAGREGAEALPYDSGNASGRIDPNA